MNSPFLIGITGGIGSGKSTITEIFKLLGVPVYDADSRAKYLMTNNDILVKSIESNFGSISYVNGQLNRQYLAEKVFSDPEATQKLNNLVHPAVAIDFSNWALEQTSTYVIKEAALLFESGSYRDLDRIILVTAPVEIRVARVLKRDPQRSKEQVKSIMARQHPVQDSIALADELLHNDGSELLIPQILAIHNKIKKVIR